MSIFKESKTYRPFAYEWAMEAAIRQNIDLYWHKHEVKLGEDIRQFHSKDGLATANVSHEQHKNMMSKFLTVFTQMDLEAGALYCKLLPYVKNNEIRNMYMAFANKEGVHQINYAVAVEELGFPDSTWTEFMEYSEMLDKIELMRGDHGDLSIPLNFAKTLANLLFAEGILLFGAFASMLNLKREGLLMGTNSINEWSLA